MAYPATAPLLDTQTIANFQNGRYRVWNVTGRITHQGDRRKSPVPNAAPERTFFVEHRVLTEFGLLLTRGDHLYRRCHLCPPQHTDSLLTQLFMPSDRPLVPAPGIALILDSPLSATDLQIFPIRSLPDSEAARVHKVEV